MIYNHDSLYRRFFNALDVTHELTSCCLVPVELPMSDLQLEMQIVLEYRWQGRSFTYLHICVKLGRIRVCDYKMAVWRRK